MDEEQLALYNQLNEFGGKITDEIDQDLLENLKKAILIRKMQISANPALLKKGLIESMDELREEYASGFGVNEDKFDPLIKADKTLMAPFMSSSILKIVNLYEKGYLVTQKNRKAVDLANELVSHGKKVLIWDIFIKNMDTLKAMLQDKIDTQVELINGSVIGCERQAVLKRFREGNSMILLADPATLAESISLHKVCQNAIYVNRNFNAAQFIQSKDRIHRINMPAGTTANYYFLLNEGSVDCGVHERLNKKEQRMLAILDADEIQIGGAEMEDSEIMSSQDIDQSYLL
jgi:SNF2 family DNA or RNA helicase